MSLGESSAIVLQRESNETQLEPLLVRHVVLAHSAFRISGSRSGSSGGGEVEQLPVCAVSVQEAVADYVRMLTYRDPSRATGNTSTAECRHTGSKQSWGQYWTSAQLLTVAVASVTMAGIALLRRKST